MNRKYLLPVLLLSISVWLVIGGARAGLNLFAPRYAGIFQWSDALLTAAFAIVEVIFLPSLARAIYTARSVERLRPIYRMLLAGTFFIVLAFPLLATPAFAALHSGQGFQALASSWLFGPWLFIFFCVLPVSMVSIGLAEMVHNETAEPRGPSQRITDALLTLGVLDPARLADEAGVTAGEVDEHLQRLSQMFSINGK